MIELWIGAGIGTITVEMETTWKSVIEVRIEPRGCDDDFYSII